LIEEPKTPEAVSPEIRTASAASPKVSARRLKEEDNILPSVILFVSAFITTFSGSFLLRVVGIENPAFLGRRRR
jgi:hypothetical protein